MRAIRPIFDGKDDLDYRTEIDAADMMACLFSEINESIDKNRDITDDERRRLRDRVDFEAQFGPEFHELIIMYEIVRWMQESGYEWNAVVPHEFNYTALALGILTVISDDTIGENNYIIHAGDRAMNELKLMLPLHWAVILLGWKLVATDVAEGKETIRFGNIVIQGDKEYKEN